jgi:hypothetical protein
MNSNSFLDGKSVYKRLEHGGFGDVTSKTTENYRVVHLYDCIWVITMVLGNPLWTRETALNVVTHVTVVTIKVVYCRERIQVVAIREIQLS